MLLYISLCTSGLALLLSIFNWHRNKTAIFLSLFLLSISVYGITHHFTVYGNDPFWLAVFYNHFTPLNLLAGPFLFFYVRGTIKDRQGISAKDIAHFIPAALHLVGILPYLFKPFSDKEEISLLVIQNLNAIQDVEANFIFPVPVAFIIRPTLLLIYTTACFILLWKHAELNKMTFNIPSKQLKITKRWLVILLTNVFVMALNFIYLTVVFITTSAKNVISDSNNLYYATGILFGFMALGLIVFPQVLYGMPQYRQVDELPEIKKSIKKLEQVITEESSSNEILTTKNDEPFIKLAERIQEHIKLNKPFTNPEFSIEHLASELQVPLNHISYCLNKVMQTKFTAYRTKLRIEFAKGLLKAGKNNDFTIEGIAQQAGFSTRSNFYNAFKAETGFTPTDFLKMSDN
jgi:AraC-like DNA-binding protein